MSQYATFFLGDRMFGLDLLAIREINRNLDITPVPHARPWIRGLINLRGQIVTILDLAVRLGLERQECLESSRTIILKARSGPKPGLPGDNAGPENASGDLMGFLADAIGEVVEADPAAMEPPSANLGEADSRFLAGVLHTGAGLLVLLDLQELLHGQ